MVYKEGFLQMQECLHAGKARIAGWSCTLLPSPCIFWIGPIECWGHVEANNTITIFKCCRSTPYLHIWRQVGCRPTTCLCVNQTVVWFQFATAAPSQASFLGRCPTDSPRCAHSDRQDNQPIPSVLFLRIQRTRIWLVAKGGVLPSLPRELSPDQGTTPGGKRDETNRCKHENQTTNKQDRYTEKCTNKHRLRRA